MEGMYSGFDAEGEKQYEAQKRKFAEIQIELFHSKGSLLTRKF